MSLIGSRLSGEKDKRDAYASREPKKICPIMALGWLANRYSPMSGQPREATFGADNLPKCLEENCQAWSLLGNCLMMPG